MTQTISVTLVSAWPDRLEEQVLSLPSGARLGEALAAAGTASGGRRHWGKCAAPDTPLTDGDRIELYRPLIAGPESRPQEARDRAGYRWQGRTRRAAKRANPDVAVRLLAAGQWRYAVAR